jgi:hypothetical protein
VASPPPSDAEPSVRVEAAVVDASDRPTRRPLPFGWAVAAFGLDVAIVVAFAAVGRRSHDESRNLAGVLGTAAPFLLGLVVGWLVVGLIARRTHDRFGTWLDVDGGFDIWLATVIVGLAARRLLWDRGIALAFVIVAAVVLGVGLMGWRGLVQRVRNGRAR